MFVGVGASRVRSLLKTLKGWNVLLSLLMKSTVGRRRGTGMGGGNDEREQTL